MSTEINVRVDRELLLQRDRVQRQAQRQVALEGTGQQKAAASGQEQVAKSGAAGGENRVRSSRTGTQTGGRAVPTSPVTAPFKRKPLPQLGGAGASGTNTNTNDDSYLALPRPYTTLPYTWPLAFSGESDSTAQGTALYGSSIKAGPKLGPTYIFGPDPNGHPALAGVKVAPNLPIVTEGSWEHFSPPENYLGYNRLFIRPGSTIDAKITSRFNQVPEKLTYEAICRIGSSSAYNFISFFSEFVTVRIELSHIPSSGTDFRALSVDPLTKNVTNVIRLLTAATGEGYVGQPSYSNIAFPRTIGTGFFHFAFVYDGLQFRFYADGKLLAAAPIGNWGFNAPISPEDILYTPLTFSGTSSNSFWMFGGYNYYIPVLRQQQDPEAAGVPSIRPAVKCIRYTAGKALYTGASFTPPTSITRLA